MFLVCGEALFDVFPGVADGSGPRTLTAAPGGSPFNVAIGLARLGQAAAFSTTLSRDSLGRQLEAMLAAEGVDHALSRRSDAPTPLALIEVDDAGVPRYGFHGLREMATHPAADALTTHGARITGLHIGSVPIVSPVSAEPLLDLATVLSADRFVAFDPNVRLAVEPDPLRWRAQVDRFRAQAHLVKVGEDDLIALHGPGVDVEAAARGWLDGRTQAVVLTKAGAGLVLFGPGESRVEVAAAPSVVVDTVGAGDTVQAALIAWLCEQNAATPDGIAALTPDDLHAMGTFAARAAAITCSRLGPDLPRRAELD